jgi:hypothetical protein
MLKHMTYVWSRPAMSMKWVGCLNHNLQHATLVHVRYQVNLLLLPLWCETKHISGWGFVLMTTSHSGRCWNKLYMYEVDLIWVWSGWGASIITYSMLQVRDQVNLLLLPCETKHISGWGCVLMTTSHSGRWRNALYIYEVDLLWDEVGGEPQS